MSHRDQPVESGDPRYGTPARPLTTHHGRVARVPAGQGSRLVLFPPGVILVVPITW